MPPAETLSPLALASAYAGKRVFVTGHTGFKGAWLCEWLLQLGARVIGYGLPSSTTPSLFGHLALAERVEHREADLRDMGTLALAIAEAQPDYVFHLAAQSLVRLSYQQPVDTYAVNVLGTVHALEALRRLAKPCAAVMVTTDKCYENREWVYGYREEDPLGGWDPYSSSKAAAEIAIASYRRSFFADHPVRIASARAGNVIGGGDWAPDRIVPDCIRALQRQQPIPVRNKTATRPWQHVLEPLSGYLWLGAALANPALCKFPVRRLTAAFNFGPDHDSNRTVAELVTEVLKHWPGSWEDRSDPKAVHEAELLQLVTDKAHALLGWKPVWDFAETVYETVQWYRQTHTNPDPKLARRLTVEQIHRYTSKASESPIPWAQPCSVPR